MRANQRGRLGREVARTSRQIKPATKKEPLAEAMIDTVRDCLLLLDGALFVRFANRNFFLAFQVTPGETVDHSIFELGSGQGNIPELRRLLHEVLPHNNSFRDFEITHDFPHHRGCKTMRLNAQKFTLIASTA